MRIHLGDDYRDVAFGIGSVVFLGACEERDPGRVTGLLAEPGSLMYRVCWGSGHISFHYEFELTDTFAPALGGGGEQGE